MGFGSLLQLFKEKSPTRPYLIEFHLYGYGEKFAVELCREITRLFGVRFVGNKTRPVHLVLYGRFGTVNEKEVIKRFVGVCRRFDLIKFEIARFDHIEKSVLCLKIKPSQELVDLKNSLALELNPVCTAQGESNIENLDFLAVLPLAGIQKKFDSVWKFLQAQRTPEIKQYLLRLSLVKNGHVLREYDFIQRRVLTEGKAASRAILNQTMEELREIIENDGRRGFSG